MKKALSLKVLIAILASIMLVIVGLGFNNYATANADQVYKVTFMLDEQTELYTEDVEEGRYASIPATPEQAGKIFEYWEYNGEKFSFKTKISQDYVLTAKWQVERQMFTIKFMVGDVVVNEQVITEGESVVEPRNFDCGEGKRFVSWDKSFDSVSEDMVINAITENKTYQIEIYGFGRELIGTEEVEHGQSLEITNIPQVDNYEFDTISGETENIIKDGKVYLIYAPVKYNVSFTVNGAPFIADGIDVDYNSCVSFPGVPSRTGYVFMGWFTDLEQDQMFDFSTPITQSIELKAKFAPIYQKFEVKFFDFDGVQYGGTQIVEEGKDAILPGAPHKEGYDFVAWNGDYTNITADTEIYPIFQIKTYNVRFFADGELISEQQVNYGDSAVEPNTVAEKQGFEFIKWDKNFNYVSRDLDVNAVYSEKTFVVMFYNYDMSKVSVTQFVKYGHGAIAPKLPAREGYNFAGWNGDYTIITEDVVFVAQYAPITYTVDFYNGSEKVNSQQVNYGERADFILCEQEGYLFYGWYLDKDFAQLFSFSDVITKDTVLYARMQLIPAVTYIVKFMDGSTELSVQTVEKGHGAIIPVAPTKEGKTFSAWVLENGQTADLTNVQSDLTLFAQYTVSTYKVEFYYGDTIYKVEEQVLHGRSATPPEQTPELEGHNFVGWNGDYTNVTEDLRILAIFEKKVYTVRFVDEFENEYSLQSITHGKKASIPLSPDKAGYAFEGWQVEFEGQMIDFSFNTPIVDNIIVYAKLSAKEYTVYYYVDNTLYDTQKVAFNSAIELLDEPDFGVDYVFSGWVGAPEIMPAKNVTVSATTLKYSYIYFMYNGQVYEEQRLLEGDEITPPQMPEFDEVRYSFAWEGLLEIMPRRDVIVNGVMTELDKDADNKVVLRIEQQGDSTIVSLYVRGKVNVGGLLVNIDVAGLGEMTSATLTDEDYSLYNAENGKLKFVWATGENVTEFYNFATFTFEGTQSAGITLEVEYVKAFVNGAAVDVDYSFTYQR